MNIRVQPADRPPLFTSVQPLITPLAASMVRPALVFTLSKIRFELSPVKVNRYSAAWSVGANSVFSPLSKVTP